MEYLIILLPIIGSLWGGLGGNFLGNRGISWVVVSCLGLSCFILIFYFFSRTLNNNIYFFEISWVLDSGLLLMMWNLLFDGVTNVMLLVVLGISFLVHLYSLDYMKNDSSFIRFFFISLFTFFMLILISGENFFQLFIGWEGVGLCSYLLISFWYTRINANKAAIKALIINRVGDVGLLIGIGLIYSQFYSLEYGIIFALIPYYLKYEYLWLGYSINFLFLCSTFLFFGVVGKSAQIGLHTWLPDAMEGPTPVSALIHAATMVTAGVFLLIRCSPLFELASSFLFIVIFFGAFTSFMASTIGMIEYDIKKIIAYSTCSQLGYMVLACGFSNYCVALYHLFTHACFKALLFLSAGTIIHALGDEQDLRKMGGLIYVLPFIAGVLCVGIIALMGFPFFAGFYSKDLILELNSGSFIISKMFFEWLMGISTMMTSFYSCRLFYLAFCSYPNGYKVSYINLHEISFFSGTVLIILSFASIFGGYFMQEFFMGMGSYFGNAIYVFPGNNFFVEIEYISVIVKIYPIFCSLAGCVIFFNTYEIKEYIHRIFYYIRDNFWCYYFFSRKWFFDSLQNAVIVLFFFNTANLIYIYVDKGFLEFLGPRGFFDVIINMSLLIIRVHQLYMWQIGCTIIISICILFGYGFMCDEIVRVNGDSNIKVQEVFRVYQIFW